MPYQWTAERERQMLLLAISRANLRPSADTWTAVAALLGGGLSASAVSQKYYKLRNESDKKLQGAGQNLSAPSTPTKRKREGEVKTPTKRSKQAVKQEILDGEPFSDMSSPVSESQGVKAEEEPKVEIDAYPTDESFYVPVDYFKNGYGQITPESSMASSSMSSYASGSYLGRV
ncbi:uncharacterized protein A1O9_10525 [Exophiala aquamarina CBS 119918]|uniref:Myb-like domain-containing protein n=1 Tax=Exophiala aquamarina CBS 119918 TaxID=1182545 RepID=A0A072PD92_9EURO|nr:uncharacterized protein A1O9_10525 [Exophiala aquamarina CBS 119918]KEF53550.1 hypothetical protein A1O9_10525 [Exophiala aquamarina CBS 119918]